MKSSKFFYYFSNNLSFYTKKKYDVRSQPTPEYIQRPNKYVPSKCSRQAPKAIYLLSA